MGREGAGDPLAHVFAVVLAGGKGERFWPLSTGTEPKAFLRLLGDESLLQATVRRVRSLVPWSQILVGAGRAHAGLARGQLPELPDGNLVLEPAGRDTAAAIGLASLHLERIDREAIMVVLPADHHVPDVEGFSAVLRRAIALVGLGPSWVVTIGMPPTRPETGYGYLEVGESLPEPAGAFRVRGFLEKPDVQTAVRLVRGGRHYWNSGIFVWRIATIQRLLSKFMPEEWDGFCRIRAAWGDGAVLAREFEAFRKVSIDHGVLERMNGSVAMVPADFAWDDLGSWDALARVLPHQEGDNVVVGEVRSLDTSGSLIVSADRPVAAVGLSGMIVVASKDGVLVCPMGRSQEVRRVTGDTR
jgi:mannose-1-phosphate guanylyltransferase